MRQLHKSNTNRLLGYPDDARLLIVNADDFGMCHSINDGIIATLGAGVVHSTTLMVPCPWAPHAIHYLQANPGQPFGVHLTAMTDPDDYVWGPLTSREKVPSLVNASGHFYNFEQMPHFLAQVDLRELEAEFRAQIETVLAAGLKPTHIDWHALRLDGRIDIFDMMFSLARQYGLAMRVRGQSIIERVQSRGLPVVDYDFLDSSSISTEGKPLTYAQLLRELPQGLSEWAVHPGLASAELSALEPSSNGFRQADYEYFTSPEARETIRQEGIVLLSYEPLQAVWKNS